MAKVIPIGGMTCPECLGERKTRIPYRSGVEYGGDWEDIIDCPTCDGKGWVLEEILEEPE